VEVGLNAKPPGIASIQKRKAHNIMAGQSSAGIQIAFSDISCGVGECGGRAFEVTPSGSIEPGDIVVFNVYGATSGMVSGLTMMRGGRLLTGSSVLSAAANVTETLSFQGDSKVQLKYPGNNIVARAMTDIMEKDNTTNALRMIVPAGSPVPLERIGFSCVGVTTNVVLYGTVKITYKIIGYKKTWSWYVPAAGGDHYFYLIENNALVYSHMITIDIDSYTTTSPVDVVVVVREYTTDALVEGAAVYINGAYRGLTDVNGRINIGSRSIGRYTIKITKSGYVDSDLDDLENDSFIVGGA
jgi:hypothetical protein